MRGRFAAPGGNLRPAAGAGDRASVILGHLLAQGNSAALPADNPIGFTKRRLYVRPLGVDQRPDWRGPHILRRQLCRPRVQHRARRHYHGALDDIL